MSAHAIVAALLLAAASRPVAAESRSTESVASVERNADAQPPRAGGRWWPLVQWLTEATRSARNTELPVTDRAVIEVARDIASFLSDPVSVISSATTDWRRLIESLTTDSPSRPTRGRQLEDSDYTALLQPAEHSVLEQRCLSLEARLERCREPWSASRCVESSALAPRLRDLDPLDWTRQLCLRFDLPGTRS